MSARLASYWLKLERKALQKAGEDQRTDMRRAFYAGATSMMDAISRGLDGAKNQQEANAVLDDLQDELDRFIVDMAVGRS